MTKLGCLVLACVVSPLLAFRPLEHLEESVLQAGGLKKVARVTLNQKSNPKSVEHLEVPAPGVGVIIQVLFFIKTRMWFNGCLSNPIGYLLGEDSNFLRLSRVHGGKRLSRVHGGTGVLPGARRPIVGWPSHPQCTDR